MLPQKQVEEAIVSTFNETEHEGKEEEKEEEESIFSVKSFLWHGGSSWDAWFSCASNQVYIYFFRSLHRISASDLLIDQKNRLKILIYF